MALSNHEWVLSKSSTFVQLCSMSRSALVYEDDVGLNGIDSQAALSASQLAEQETGFEEWALSHHLFSDDSITPLPAWQSMQASLFRTQDFIPGYMSTDGSWALRSFIKNSYPLSTEDIHGIREFCDCQTDESADVEGRGNPLFMAISILLGASFSARELSSSVGSSEFHWRSQVHSIILHTVKKYVNSINTFTEAQLKLQDECTITQPQPFGIDKVVVYQRRPRPKAMEKTFPKTTKIDSAIFAKLDYPNVFQGQVLRSMSKAELSVTKSSREFLFGFCVVENEKHDLDKIEVASKQADMAVVTLLRHQRSLNVRLPVYALLMVGQKVIIRNCWWQEEESLIDLRATNAPLPDGRTDLDLTSPVDTILLFILLVNMFSTFPRIYYEAMMKSKDQTAREIESKMFNFWRI